MRADGIREALKTCDLGERIVALRLQKRWSQLEMAQRIDLSPTYISALENDRLRPSPFVVRKLAFAFDISTEELLHGELPTLSTSEKVPA